MEKSLEQPKKQIVLEELDKSNDAVDFSKLPEGDKFQVLTRYLSDVCSINKSTLQIVADLYVLLEFICEKMGIDVKAKKQELARKIKAQMEQDLEQSKKELKKAAKSHKA